MDLDVRQLRLKRCLCITGILLLALVLPSFARDIAQLNQQALADFDTAERMRQELKSRPLEQRTRSEYQRVTEAYRRVYYSAPTCMKADASAFAVGEMLAETGRRFRDAKSLQSAIGQYEFLRREYPGSRNRVDALFAIGQIYKNDLGDPDKAKAAFQELLSHFPRSRLAEQARAALAALEHPQEKRKAAEVRESGVSERQKAEAHDATQNAAKSSPLPLVTGLRHWSTPDYTRVAIDLDAEVQYQAGRVPDPDRIFFDLHDTKLASSLVGKTFDVEDGFLRKVRVAQFSRGITRVVLEVDDVSDYSAFLLPNPYRLIIDIHGRRARAVKSAHKQAAPQSAVENASAKTRTVTDLPQRQPVDAPSASAASHRQNSVSPRSERLSLSTRVADGSTAPLKPEPETVAQPVVRASADVPHTKNASAARLPGADEVIKKSVPETAKADATESAVKRASQASDLNPAAVHKAEVAIRPATAAKAAPHVELSAAADKPKVASDDAADLTLARLDSPGLKASRPTSAPTFESVAPREKRNVHAAQPTANGERSLIRVLGLKIGRIVVDAGHGGHDTGTIGPNGFREKDLVLDVALRLGKLLESKLGAEVIYTRNSDVFVPLETRTAIANQNQADLFISIHANSSNDPSARGVETYYLNFTSSADALEVAARENAVSEKSIFQLQDLIKRIALKEKIEESREFAADVQSSLWSGVSTKSQPVRNRGVKKAPFIVLIGANMPSILAEISFLSNPTDEKRLQQPEYRQKIAEYLYRGIGRYANGLSGVKVAQKHRQ